MKKEPQQLNLLYWGRQTPSYLSWRTSLSLLDLHNVGYGFLFDRILLFTFDQITSYIMLHQMKLHLCSITLHKVHNSTKAENILTEIIKGGEFESSFWLHTLISSPVYYPRPWKMRSESLLKLNQAGKYVRQHENDASWELYKFLLCRKWDWEFWLTSQICV